MPTITYRKSMTLPEFKEAYDKAVKDLHPFESSRVSDNYLEWTPEEWGNTDKGVLCDYAYLGHNGGFITWIEYVCSKGTPHIEFEYEIYDQ